MRAVRRRRRETKSAPAMRKAASSHASMNEAAAVIDRMKMAVRVKTDTELATKIGVSKTTVASWRSRNSIPLFECVGVAEDAQVSLDWLIFGTLTHDTMFGFESAKGEPGIDFDLLTAVLRERKFEIEGAGSTWEDDLKRARRLIAEYQRYAGLVNTAALEGVSRNDFVKTLRTLVQPVGGPKGGKATR